MTRTGYARNGGQRQLEYMDYFTDDAWSRGLGQYQHQDACRQAGVQPSLSGDSASSCAEHAGAADLDDLDDEYVVTQVVLSDGGGFRRQFAGDGSPVRVPAPRHAGRVVRLVHPAVAAG